MLLCKVFRLIESEKQCFFRVRIRATKGVRTQQYIIRRKLMLWVHGIEVIEI